MLWMLTQYSKTDIAYSPNFTGASTISYQPVKNTEIAFISKYVGSSIWIIHQPKAARYPIILLTM
jgi:hypothetical protein